MAPNLFTVQPHAPFLNSLAEDWLARTETPEDVRPRIRELLDSRIRDGRLELPTVVLKGVKS